LSQLWVRGDRKAFRHPWMAAVGVAAGALAFAAMAAQIDGDSAGPLEVDVFRALNGLPAFLAYVLWLPMQFGNFLILPLGAVGALIGKQWRLAAAFVIAGVGKYGFARLIKDEFVRHRPAVFLEDVQVGFGGSDSGLGFVSGHAIVAFAFATVLHPYLRSRAARVVLWSAAAIVLLGRVFVGAHLPMDVVGGAGVGLALGLLANLVLGIPGRDRATPSS
jgi:undecaprenyl-diphosphatase